MTLTLIVEIVVAVLLLVTLGFSLVLNRRLGNLRANQDEMRRLIGDFDKALAKARQGMAELKTASAAADNAHEERMKHAKTLRDELGFMVETADRLADRLAGEATASRGARQERAQERSEQLGVQRDGEMLAGKIVPPRAQAPVTPFPARRAAAGAPANGAPANAAAPVGNAKDFKIEPRSEAERELLMALRQSR